MHGFSLHNLSVVYPGPQLAVVEASLHLRAGGCLALIGESGCGKSTLGRALLGLATPGIVTTGTLVLGDGPSLDLACTDERTWRGLRGRALAWLPQDPGQALGAQRTIGAQLETAWRAHHRDTAGLEARSAALFARLELPESVRRAYPFQLSGGQAQRAALALALLNGPHVLVADEPTTALDTHVRRQTLRLLRDLGNEEGLALLLITHDIAGGAEIADQLAVMYAGSIVETGPTAAVLRAPIHPYTQALLACVPRSGTALPSPLPGQPPLLATRPCGCAFAPRCRAALPECDQAVPPLAGGAQRAACWVRPPQVAQLVQLQPTRRPSGQPALAVTGLSFTRPGPRHEEQPILRDIAFTIAAGERVGLVGASGSGKSTLARCLLGLERPAAGSILWQGQDLAQLDARRWRPLRPQIQPVFQDSRAALNPRRTVGELLVEPLHYAGIGSKATRNERAQALLRAVGLDAAILGRRPPALSTGQCQRVAIARALMTEPALLICDEALAALDLSLQAQILALFDRLQQRYGFAMLFISHDLAVVRSFAERVLVLEAGRICEELAAHDLHNAMHPHTRALLAAAPTLFAEESHAHDHRHHRPDAAYSLTIPLATDCAQA